MHKTVSGLRGENPQTMKFWSSYTSATARSRPLLHAGVVLLCPPLPGTPQCPHCSHQTPPTPPAQPLLPVCPFPSSTSGCRDVAPKGGSSGAGSRWDQPGQLRFPCPTARSMINAADRLISEIKQKGCWLFLGLRGLEPCGCPRGMRGWLRGAVRSCALG